MKNSDFFIWLHIDQMFLDLQGLKPHSFISHHIFLFWKYDEQNI